MSVYFLTNYKMFCFNFRDTTVQTLTLQPSVKDGLIVYEDSPLVSNPTLWIFSTIFFWMVVVFQPLRGLFVNFPCILIDFSLNRKTFICHLGSGHLNTDNWENKMFSYSVPSLEWYREWKKSSNDFFIIPEFFFKICSFQICRVWN